MKRRRLNVLSILLTGAFFGYAIPGATCNAMKQQAEYEQRMKSLEDKVAEGDGALMLIIAESHNRANRRVENLERWQRGELPSIVVERAR